MVTLGDKLHFGLDYRITNFKKPVMGYAKVWFGNNFMCTQEDLVYVDSYIFGGLKQIADAKRADIAFKDKDAVFNYFYNRFGDEDDFSLGYFINFSTASDDFTIFAYLDSEDTIHLIWRLENTYTPFEDLNASDKEVHYYAINKDEFTLQLSNMRNEISGAIDPEFF